MGDSAAATAAPRTVRVGDETIEVKPLRMFAVGRLQAWLRGRPRPDYFGDARRQAEGLDADEAKALYAEARRKDQAWPPDLLMDFEGAGPLIVGDPDGRLELLWNAVEQDRPGFARDDAEALMRRLDPEGFLAVMNAALGIREEEPAGPKASPGPEPSTTS